MPGGRFAIACARCLRILQTADGGAPVVTWLSSRRGNRWGARCEGKKGQVVRGLARDDEARKLRPKGLETLEVRMKLAKSLLLGSAAGLAAVVGAQAADLPSVKAAPVEYVRVCSTYGVGFFYVPGTDSCLRISGRVRADFRYVEPQTRVQDA